MRLIGGVKLDKGIESVVERINSIEGVSTYSSCSGWHKGHHGPHVAITFKTQAVYDKYSSLLKRNFAVRRNYAPGHGVKFQTEKVSLTLRPIGQQTAKEFWDLLKHII